MWRSNSYTLEHIYSILVVVIAWYGCLYCGLSTARLILRRGIALSAYMTLVKRWLLNIVIIFYTQYSLVTGSNTEEQVTTYPLSIIIFTNINATWVWKINRELSCNWTHRGEVSFSCCIRKLLKKHDHTLTPQTISFGQNDVRKSLADPWWLSGFLTMLTSRTDYVGLRDPQSALRETTTKKKTSVTNIGVRAGGLSGSCCLPFWVWAKQFLGRKVKYGQSAIWEDRIIKLIWEQESWTMFSSVKWVTRREWMVIAPLVTWDREYLIDWSLPTWLDYEY